MPRMSRKYWALVIMAVVAIGVSYTLVWVTEQLVDGYRVRRPAASPRR